MESGEKSRLRWRCRRGTKEMDILLEQFLAEYYDQLIPVEQAAFRYLLEKPDPDIMDWIMGKAEPPTADIKNLIDILRTIGFRNLAPRIEENSEQKSLSNNSSFRRKPESPSPSGER